MKITKSQLKQIIKEELERALNENHADESLAATYAMFEKYDLKKEEEEAVVKAAWEVVSQGRTKAPDGMPANLIVPTQELIDINLKLRKAHGVRPGVKDPSVLGHPDTAPEM